VTIVQYRDKTSDTGALISTARRLHEKCKAHNIPLLINDRVDVALAVGCEGVHVGQDDMSASEARRILGNDAVIGVTVSSIEEARIAVERGADYLGIGTLYATNTKKNTKDIIGINGTRQILRYLGQGSEAERKVKTVCIGGVILTFDNHQVNRRRRHRVRHNRLSRSSCRDCPPVQTQHHPTTIQSQVLGTTLLARKRF
jgi:thiamine-phosphate diphosphorylase/hydroxyethylthiazole kinase